MTDQNQPHALPEKVLRRHAELLADLLPEFTRVVLEEGQPADAALNAYLRAHREFGSRDRRFLSQALFSYFRWYGWTINRLRLSPSEAAMVGTSLDADELPPSFRYIESRSDLPFTPDAMGSLDIAEKQDILNEGYKDVLGAEPLTLGDLVLPEFETVIDPAAKDRCITAFQQRPPTWLRARKDPAEIIHTLTEQGISSSRHTHLAEALSLEGGISLPNVLKEHNGQYVVQDISSQCAGQVCAPGEGEEWWDCCAGAGGKAIHLMDLMKQTGKVLATDIRSSALKELKKRARKHGIRHIRTQPFNAVNDEPFKKVFDGVLVDAPCSGWGTWGRNPDARWRASRRDVMQNAGRQLKILDNAAWCVKPGGVLVYAVCSLTRPETEEVVMNFLDHHASFKLEPFLHPLTGEQTGGQVQIWPWDADCDGMFIARFRRMED
ncbi:MAG TPA: methyltransferase domain-containing protein [Pontiella sp.]